MLHSLICCNEDGFVLLARYFQSALPLAARKRFEAQLAHVCATQMPAHFWDKLKKEQPPSDQFLVCEGQFVVLRQVGELRFFLSGSCEYDELIHTIDTEPQLTSVSMCLSLVAEILNVWHAMLALQLEKKLTEASLLANYAKVVVTLDEMVQQGHIENLDDASIEQMAKLRPYPTK